jgi:hypothetical protein
MVNAKLILLLANHIGDLDVLREALQRVRAGEELLTAQLQRDAETVQRQV